MHVEVLVSSGLRIFQGLGRWPPCSTRIAHT